MIEIALDKTLNNNYQILLFNNGKQIKVICNCYEEDYAIMIASSLANNSGGKFRKIYHKNKIY